MRFDYWVVRYLPNPVREEFVNVAVIAGAGNDWAVRRLDSLDSASRLGGNLRETRAFFHRIDSAIDTELAQLETMYDGRDRALGRGILEDLRIRMHGIVQLANPRPVLAQTASEAADLAFGLMVATEPRTPRHRAGTVVKRRLYSEFLAAPDLSEHVRSSQRLRLGNLSTAVDLAVEDGVVRQLSNVWDFTVKNTENLETRIQAWSFLIREMRGGQAHLVAQRGRAGAQPVQVARDVEVNSIFTAPLDGTSDSSLEAAQDAWQRLGVRVLPEERADEVIQNARTLIGV